MCQNSGGMSVDGKIEFSPMTSSRSDCGKFVEGVN